MLVFDTKTYFDYLPMELKNRILFFVRVSYTQRRFYNCKFLFRKTNYLLTSCKCYWGNRKRLNNEFKQIVFLARNNNKKYCYNHYYKWNKFIINLAQKKSDKLIEQDFPMGFSCYLDYLNYINKPYYSVDYIKQKLIDGLMFRDNLYKNIWGDLTQPEGKQLTFNNRQWDFI